MKRKLAVCIVLILVTIMTFAFFGCMNKESDTTDVIEPQEGLFENVYVYDMKGECEYPDIKEEEDKYLVISNGYSDYYTSYNGLGLKVSYKNASVTFAADLGNIYCISDKKIDLGEDDKKCAFDDNGIAYWRNGGNIPGARVTMVLKEGEHIIGAAVIEIGIKLLYEDAIEMYYAELLKSVSFPKINGKYQNVTEEYLLKYFGKKVYDEVIPNGISVFEEIYDYDKYSEDEKKQIKDESVDKYILIENGYSNENSEDNGIGIEFSYPGRELEIITDKGYLECKDEEKSSLDENCKEYTIIEKGAIYWKNQEKNDRAKVIVKVKEDSHIVGAVLIIISYEKNGISTSRYYANIVVDISFPKFGEQCQNVTDEYLIGYFAEY